jgi:dTDP-4-dehydrorhamnose reductase
MSCLVDRKTRVLITGGTGWLAQHLYSSLADRGNIEIHLTYRNVIPEWNDPERCHVVEIAEARGVWVRLVQSVMPDIIIHTAAMSSPVACEMIPELATIVNITSPTELVEAALKFVPNCIFLNCSTDLVYGGPNAGTLNESADAASFEPEVVLPEPSTMYGKTKLAFEAVASSLRFGVSLRLSNMIGPGHCYRAGGGKFLQWLETSASTRAFVTLKNDERRSFVSVFDVIAVIERYVDIAVQCREQGLQQTDHYVASNFFAPFPSASVFNVGGPKGLSRFELAIVVAESMGLKVIVVDSDPGSAETSAVAWQVASVTCAQMDANTAPKAYAPRDATMNSSHTISTLGVEFVSMKDLLQSKRSS